MSDEHVKRSIGFSSGCVWCEADTDTTDLNTVIKNLLSGQYNDPQRIIGFNTAEGWSEDVSADVAHELRRRCDLQNRDIPSCLQGFTDRHESRYIKSPHGPARP